MAAMIADTSAADALAPSGADDDGAVPAANIPVECDKRTILVDDLDLSHTDAGWRKQNQRRVDVLVSDFLEDSWGKSLLLKQMAMKLCL